jgi:DNA-binding SARP family transcriptional activator
MRFLGRLQLELDGEPLVDLVSSKAQALLCYIAVNGRPYARQSLAALLWDEMPEADARRNLRGVLMHLRQAVEPYLLITHQAIAFNPEPEHWIDTIAFRQFLKRQHTGTSGWQLETINQLRSAVTLYQGDFLEGFHVRQAPSFEAWVTQERATLRGLAIQSYQTLSAYHAEKGELEQAISDSRELINLDQTGEQGHRQLIRLLAQSGQRSAALGQYELCRKILADELSVEPAPETVELVDQIRAGQFGRGAGEQKRRGEILPPPPVSPLQSPFIAGPPILHPNQFFGRQREIKRIFNLLKQPPLQNAAIIGERRSGKTSLLHYLKNVSSTQSRPLHSDQRQGGRPRVNVLDWIFIDFQDPRLGTREGLLRHILVQLRLPLADSCEIDYFMDVVSENLTSPTVILFDEIGVALERYGELDNAFWESLRSLATNQAGGNLAFILAAHESPSALAQHSGYGSPFFNIFGYTAVLGPFLETEARQLMDSSPLPFSEEDRAWMLTESGRWPMPLQILCRERLLSLEDGETGDDWREEALRQIRPFMKNLLEAD